MVKTKSESKPGKMKQKRAEPEEKVSKRIDIGKIMALKRAGWNDKDIADEMRMEPDAVSGIIRQYIRRLQMGG